MSKSLSLNIPTTNGKFEAIFRWIRPLDLYESEVNRDNSARKFSVVFRLNFELMKYVHSRSSQHILISLHVVFEEGVIKWAGVSTL